MPGRSLALAALLALLFSASAWAAPVTVQLRVEGSASTTFEGPVTSDGKTIDKGAGPHQCDGTAGGVHSTPVPTMTSALDDASIAAGFPWTGTWFDFGDYGIDSIGPDANESLPTPGDPFGGKFWGYALNLVPAGTGGCSQEVTNGDEVLYAFDFFSKAHLLRLTGPRTVPVGQPATLNVTDGQKSPEAPIPAAAISGAPGPVTTGDDGRATVTFDSPGFKRLKADRLDSVRSATLVVCVSGPGQVCEPSAPVVRDSRAPRATISGIRDGQRLRRGPRFLRGTAVDDTAVTQVKLNLRRHVAGKPCQWWSGRREKFVGTSCDKRFFFAIGTDRNWSYLLPRRLPPGRYVLDVKAFDRSRNRDERFVRGQNRVVFYVGARKPAKKGAARRGPGAAGASRARGVPVGVMVTGRAATLAGPVTVRARATRVRAGKRRCLVAAGTPLAALAAAMRGPADYRLRDFGHCSNRTTAGSGQLFVNRIGPDSNRGSDGWFYKVAGRAGTAGAADPAGPLGNGRLRRGARVLWFFCVFEQEAGSCQRTLELDAPGTGKPGSPLSVKVVGRDNEGDARPVEGARVTLGQGSGLTGADGRCTLTAPAAGRWSLRAERAGMVRAFPVRVTVG